MLDKDYKYFLENQEHFVSKYPDKFIVLNEEKVIAVYDSHELAHSETIKTLSVGSFLIQHCVL